MKVRSWQEFKTFIDQRSISIQWFDIEDHYYMAGVDGAFTLYYTMYKDNGADQLEFESSYKNNGNKNIENKTTSNIQKVSVYESEGTFATIVSHDFTKKSTWYQNSTSVTGETLTNTTGNTYKTANTNLINLTNGLQFGEDSLQSTYPINIYDNSILQSSGYTIDHDLGEVTFTSAPTGPVTADYSYAGNSTFRIVPSPGKILSMKHAELDFSVNVNISKVHFDIYAYNPNDLPNKVLVERVTYNNMRDILKVANEVTTIQGIDDLTQDVIRAVFLYGRVIQLKDSQGIEMRISIDSDEPFSGEMGTISLYTVEEDE